VDFSYVPLTGEVLVNEINTMPSLVKGSMWFDLWEWLKMVVEGGSGRVEK